MMEEKWAWVPCLGTRLLDVLASAVVLLVLFRFFVAPRLFTPPPAYALPLVLSMLDGSTYHLENRRGRVVFLEFSTSWCDACKASIPLVERYARMHPDVDVITVDSGESPPAAARFVIDRALRPHFLALDVRDRITDAFDVSGYPTILVIDRRGRMRARWDGFNPAVEQAMEHARVSL
jgi:thiol-disulfide isomerase/thioredoxin